MGPRVIAGGRIRYARNGDVRLAYRAIGDGDTTIVAIPGWISNVDLYDDPISPFGPLLEQLAEEVQLIVWDKRGTGLSDPVTHTPSLDERMDDLHSVIDASGAICPTIFGVSEGGPMSVLFAATYPESVHSLVLYGTAARFTPELPDHPWGLTPRQISEQRKEIENDWGDGALAEYFFGEAAEIPAFLELYSRAQRVSASPSMALLLWDALMQLDVSNILHTIRTPTLVLSRRGDRVAPFEAARAMAAAIPSAEFRELPPGPHGMFDTAMGAEILEFTCERPRVTTDERVLTTVLFTDIVGSTEQLSASGDETWRRRLDDHDRLVDRVLTKYGGRRAKHTGDGVFALFDGPTKAARCGLDLVSALVGRGIRIRAGVHTGECERRGDEWSGMAIHVGARIGGAAGPCEVLTSRTVRDLSAGSGLVFTCVGAQRLKGLAEDTDLYRVSAR